MKYKKYPQYIETDVQWIRTIPSNWIIKRLKYVCPISNTKLNSKPENTRYLSMENIESWTGKLIEEAEIEEVESAVNVFKEGDILFGKLRPYLAKAYQAEFDGVCSTELVVLKPTKEISGKYAYYLILSHGFIKMIDALTYGVKMPRASPDQIHNMLFVVPPKKEQKKIVDFLDGEIDFIDELIRRYHLFISNLQEKRISLITRAVTKGLNPNVKMKHSGVEWIEEIPEHWEIKKIKYLFKVVNGSTPKSGVEDYWDGDIVWVTPDDLGNLLSSYISESARMLTIEGYKNCGTTLVPKGSIVISTRAPIGHLAIADVELCTNQGCKSLILISKHVVIKYYFYLLKAAKEILNSLGKGTTFIELGTYSLESLNIPLLPKNEQEQIVQYLNYETQKIDTLIEKIKKQIEYLNEYRISLITNAVTGKIDVRGIN